MNFIKPPRLHLLCNGVGLFCSAVMERIYETSAKAEEGGEEKDYCVPGNVGEAGPSQTSELETNKTQPPETENSKYNSNIHVHNVCMHLVYA